MHTLKSCLLSLLVARPSSLLDFTKAASYLRPNRLHFEKLFAGQEEMLVDKSSKFCRQECNPACVRDDEKYDENVENGREIEQEDRRHLPGELTCSG